MFITLEGLDGSGKTTQAQLLGARLEAEGVEVVLTREPGGTPLGEEIRDLVLHGGDVAPWAEAALYAASRAQHVEQVIRPALARGATVICDRYVDSSVAYQGIARGLGLERVLELNLAAVDGLMPDRTILLEIGVGDAVARMGGEPRPDRARGRRLPRARRRAPTGSSRTAFPTATSSSTARRARAIAEEIRWSPCVTTRVRGSEQAEAKRLLTAALADGDAHAFLFHGPAGVGKTSAAFAFAGALLGDAAAGRASARTPTCASSSRSAT